MRHPVRGSQHGTQHLSFGRKLRTVGYRQAAHPAKMPLEKNCMYGGTVLGTAVWFALNEPRADHLPIVEALIAAAANLNAVRYPKGNERVDELLRRHGAKASIKFPFSSRFWFSCHAQEGW